MNDIIKCHNFESSISNNTLSIVKKLGCLQQRFLARFQKWKRSLNEICQKIILISISLLLQWKEKRENFFSHHTYQFLIARYSSLFSNKLIWRKEPRYGWNLRQKRKFIATTKLKEMRKWKRVEGEKKSSRKRLKQLLIFVFSWVGKRSWKYAVWNNLRCKKVGNSLKQVFCFM